MKTAKFLGGYQVEDFPLRGSVASYLLPKENISVAWHTAKCHCAYGCNGDISFYVFGKILFLLYPIFNIECVTNWVTVYQLLTGKSLMQVGSTELNGVFLTRPDVCPINGVLHTKLSDAAKPMYWCMHSLGGCSYSWVLCCETLKSELFLFFVEYLS